jgi:hypothetical protein
MRGRDCNISGSQYAWVDTDQEPVIDIEENIKVLGIYVSAL